VHACLQQILPMLLTLYQPSAWSQHLNRGCAKIIDVDLLDGMRKGGITGRDLNLGAFCT
jgi:hypothetical protein